MTLTPHPQPGLEQPSAVDPAHAHDVVVTDDRQRRLILAAMCVALVAVVASVSGLNVAQQALAQDMEATQSQVLWIINGYTLALAALLMPVGAVGDRWGRKPILLVGLVMFAVTNLASAFATEPSTLIALRVVAGVAAAMIMPVTLSVITTSFPREAQAKAMLNLSVEQRVAKALLATARCFGYDKDDRTLLAFTPSRHDLADYAGATYESTIRALSLLQRKKLIKAVGRELRLLDNAALGSLIAP